MTVTMRQRAYAPIVAPSFDRGRAMAGALWLSHLAASASAANR